MTLSDIEEEFKNRFKLLKSENGLHSPSIQEIESNLNIKINTDACYLSNPYAQDLVYKWLHTSISKEALMYYPPSNTHLAKYIGAWRKLDYNRILVGNGAIEIIFNMLNAIKNKKIVIPIPSFSTYYEVLEAENEIFYYPVSKADDFRIDVPSFLEYISECNPDYIIVINPSNPTGKALSIHELKTIHAHLKSNQVLIIDESFIDFTEGEASLEYYASSHENIIIVRSLSKDFGLSGLRVGYSFLPQKMKEELLTKGFLWNINGLASVFCSLLNNEKFIEEYNGCKIKYVNERNIFLEQMKSLPVKIYNSSANFFLIETHVNAENLFVRLIYKYGIYTRLLNDKIGLNGNFLRIAIKGQIENRKIAEALQNELFIVN